MKLLVEGQKISSFDSPPIKLVAGSIEFVPIELKCSSEWDGLLITVQFIQKDKTISKYIGEARTLKVPADISVGWLMISCFGAKADTTVFGTVNGYETQVYPAGLSSVEQEPIPPTPNLYNQLISEIKRYAEETEASADKVKEAQETSAQAKTIADQIQKNAKDGVYNGRDGEQGPQGIQGPQGPKGEPGTTDFNQLQNLPVISVLKDSIELTTLSDSFYIINVESCYILVSNKIKETFTKGVKFCKSGDSFSYWDNEGMHFILNFHNDAEWVNNYTPTRTEMDEELVKKQDKLVSGKNIKTINNTPVLGSGNIDLPSSPITVIDDEKYTIRQEGLFYFTKDAEMGFISSNYAPGQGLVRTKNIHANTFVYKKDLGDSTTLIFFTPFEPSEDVPGNVIGGLSFTYVDSEDAESSYDISDFVTYIGNLFDILGNVGYQDPNRIIITKEHNHEDGTFSFDTIGIGKGLKLENQELSVNAEGLDISKAIVEDAVAGIDKTELISLIKTLVKENLQIKSVGTGLKFENGVLSLDTRS